MNLVAADVDGLFGQGRKIAGRSGAGGSSAKGLRDGIDSAAGTVGHPLVRSGMASFLSGVTDAANSFGCQIQGGGDNVSSVASTIREQDNEGAHGLQPSVTECTEIEARIHGHVR